MHLVVQVVFNYQIGTHALNNYGKYTNKRELIRAIEQTENPYELVITRTVQIVDTDSKHENSGIELFFPEEAIEEAIEIHSENIKFVLADKLMYPRDVRQILMQKYNSVLNFDNQEWNEDIPVLYSGVMEETDLRDSITGVSTHYTLRYVNCRPLTLDDIVINKKMNQIWPKATDALPAPLLAFLSRKKERVYTK